MITICVKCGKTSDDSRCSTLCPHEPFLSEEQCAQKDLALSFIGKKLCFIDDLDGETFEVQSINWRGMVTLRGLACAEFAPNLLVVKETRK